MSAPKAGGWRSTSRITRSPCPALELDWDATPVGEGLRWMVKGLWDEAAPPDFSTNGHSNGHSTAPPLNSPMWGAI